MEEASTQLNDNIYESVEIKDFPKKEFNNSELTEIAISLLRNITLSNKVEEQNKTSSEGPSYHLGNEALVLIPLYSFILFLSVVGNSLVIVTLLKNKRMRSSTNVYLLNLAFSDLLLGVVCMPFTLTGFLLRDFIFGGAMCRIIPFLQAVSVSVSAWTLVAISFERYFGICYPLKSRVWRSISHAYKMIAIVWLGSMVSTLPIAVTSTLQPIGSRGRNKCREDWPDETIELAYNILLDIVLLLIPLFVMVFNYFSISKVLWEHIQDEKHVQCDEEVTSSGDSTLIPLQIRHQSSLQRDCSPDSPRGPHLRVELAADVLKCESQSLHSLNQLHTRSHKHYSKVGLGSSILRKSNYEKSLKNKKKIIKMLGVVVLEFFICWTPIYVINTVALCSPSTVYHYLGMTAISIFHLLAYFSSCCNPLTYCFMNKNFRNACLVVLRCKTQRKYIHTPLPGVSNC